MVRIPPRIAPASRPKKLGSKERVRESGKAAAVFETTPGDCRPVLAPSSGDNVLAHRLRITCGPNKVQRTALDAFGLDSEAQLRFCRGDVVGFTVPSPGGDETIGSLQLLGDRVRSVCISVHNESRGLRALLGFREDSRDLARAFGKDHVEVGGAAVINDKLERKLQRMGFRARMLPVIDELGNTDDMQVYLQTFAVKEK